MNAGFWAEQELVWVHANIYGDGEDRDERTRKQWREEEELWGLKAHKSHYGSESNPEQASIEWANSLPVSTHFQDAYERKIVRDA